MRISDWSSDVCSSDLGKTIHHVPPTGSFVFLLRHPMCRHSLGVAGLDVITSCVAGPGGGRAAAQSPCKDDPGNTSHGYNDASDGETPPPLRPSAPKESRWAPLAVPVEPADRLQHPPIPAQPPAPPSTRDSQAPLNPP